MRSRALALAAAGLVSAGCGGAGGEGAAAAPTRHTVEIRGFSYAPSTLTVAPGDTVVWINRDAVPHTVTGADGGLQSGSMAAGATWSWVAAAPGTEATYTCDFHPAMTAEITVGAEAGANTASSRWALEPGEASG